MSDPSDREDNAPDFSFLGEDTKPETNADAEVPPLQVRPPEVNTSPTPDAPHSGTGEAKQPSVRKRSASKQKTENTNSPQEKVPAGSDTPTTDGDGPRAKLNNALLGYAAAITLLYLFLLVTGRISLSGNHQLESLPDIKPLGNEEFQLVPPTASLAPRHTLQLGESERFGDVILTPQKVTFEPLKFAHMTSGVEAADLETSEVMKLWFEVQNASADMAFIPWSVGLMCHHSQRGSQIVSEENTLTNSWLIVDEPSPAKQSRVLNFMHSPESSFNIVGFGGDKMLAPGESQLCFVASSDTAKKLADADSGYRWRVQIRKGINRASGQGVTTLVDIEFDSSQVETAGGA